jgi:RNA polymerase sigma-70 factor (ECF subfamily)
MSEKPAVSSDPSLLSTLQEGRRQFLALVEGLRPELHRYCARMTGSVIDGEDVVQESLARAYYELSELRELPALRAWLFRIAHNRALDLLRARQLRTSEPLEAGLEVAAGDELEPENALAREQAVHAAVSRFLELPPAQRSCVILMDVLEHSLEEIAALLELSIPAVKAALHRGRATLRELAVESQPRLVRSAPSPAIARYAALFNARDWDGVRAMLVDDVKLDLVSRLKRSGRGPVGGYFTNYDKVSDWYLVPAWVEGREAIAVFRDRSHAQPGYFIELTWRGDQVAVIRDYRYVPYIAREAAIVLAADRQRE